MDQKYICNSALECPFKAVANREDDVLSNIQPDVFKSDSLNQSPNLLNVVRVLKVQV